MPLLWSYLLRAYLRVFILSVSGFVAVLLVTRLKEIARFSALAGDAVTTLLFTLYQIPHILPIAIPISCLISSILLFQKMSRTHELTALRSSGLGLRDALAPILLASLLICGLNFFICSEVTTYSRQRSREMLFDETTVNPLVLLQRQKLLRIKDSYVDMLSDDENSSAKDVIFITTNESNNRLSLMTAQKFTLENETLKGYNVALVSNLGGEEEGFDTLIIENQSFMSTHGPSLSRFMKINRTRLNPSSLPLRLLLVRSELKGKNTSKAIEYTYTELLRRISLGLSAFSFTFLGAAFGIEISRNKSKKGLILTCLLALFLLACYMIGKQIKNHIFLSTLSFTVPHLLILFMGVRSLKKLSRGIA